jgi:hypothetical protein
MVFNIEGLLSGAFGIGGGVFWFFQGFRELKSSRTIQNVPTSRIMTGAVGTNVEIKGKVIFFRNELLKAPISGRPSVFYSLEIQKLVRSNNNSYWKKIDHIYSSAEFYVDDDSGAIAQVFIEDAKVRRQGGVEEFQTQSNKLLSLPERLISVLRQNEERLKAFKLKNTSGLFSQKYRFLEWSFQPGDSAYVLGYAESGIQPPKINKLKFAQFLQAKKMIENDPQLQARFDRNKDGFLDAGELERAAQIVGAGLQFEPVPVPEKEPAKPVKLIFRKRKGSALLISNLEEKDLIKKLSLKATLKVWGGSAVAIGSSVYLIFALNL